MALNDLRFHVHRRRSVGAPLFLVLAVGLLGYGIALGEDRAWIGAILPGTLAIALWSTRPREVIGNVADDGIVLSRPPALIPFESIRQIEADFDPEEPAPPTFRINVQHEWGTIRIPDSPDINSAGIFDALISRYSVSGSRAIHSFLHGYVARHEANFGPDRVWTFRTTSNTRKDIHKGDSAQAVVLAMLISSIAWIAIAASKDGLVHELYSGLGGTLLFISLLTLLVVWAVRRQNRTGIKRWRESSLAITPVGLALIQGDVKGELLWDQLRDVKLKPGAQDYEPYLILDDPTERLYIEMDRAVRRSSKNLILSVDGAQIIVPDFYDRPIALIHDRILRYWKPEGIRAPVDLG